MATSTKRAAKRLSERERSRRARQSTASKSPRADAGAAAGDPEAIAAAAALNPEAAAALAAAAQASGGGAGEAATPPLTMDQLPPEAAKALGPMLERARAGAAGGLPDDDKKRSKKFLTLEMELAELLTFPAGPALMAGDTFCGEHFATQGPMLAHQLTLYAESHPSTYNTLVWLARQGSLLVIATSIVGYVLPPMIHHGLPAPGAMRSHYGMETGHAHGPPLGAVA